MIQSPWYFTGSSWARLPGQSPAPDFDLVRDSSNKCKSLYSFTSHGGSTYEQILSPSDSALGNQPAPITSAFQELLPVIIKHLESHSAVVAQTFQRFCKSAEIYATNTEG